MPNIPAYTFTELVLGQSAEFTVVISEAMKRDFAELTGDKNPLHMDEEYASTTEYEGTIVHGMLGASFFSRLIGMHLPGRNSVYLSQQISFKHPVRVGMNVRVCGEIIQIVASARVIKLRTQLFDAATGVCAIDGEAMVKLLA